MGQPHKHADLIKAWSDGAIIQHYHSLCGWVDCADNKPSWNVDVQYRIKPEEKKPVVRWMWAMKLTVFKGCDDTHWSCLGDFFTEEEIQKKYPLAEVIKLEWSKTEFPD